MKKTLSFVLSLVMLLSIAVAADFSAFAATSVKSISLSTTSYTYDGKVKKPKVTAKNNKGKTIPAKYYTVKYSKGRKNVGKYTVKVTFKGKYKGSKSKTFTIKPKATAISSMSATAKGFKVTYKKQATQTTGYQIMYSTSSKYSSSKTVTVTKNKTTSKTVSGLAAHKKYYAKVRTYKTVKVNGKSTKIYSSWSKSKNATTKTGLKLNASTPLNGLVKNATKVTIFNGEMGKMVVANTNKKVSWSSSDTKVATVNQSGEVKAVGSGTCTIKAKTSNDYITCKVVVPAYYPENYSIPDFGSYFSVKLINYDYNSENNIVINAYNANSVYNVNPSWLEDYADALSKYGFAYQGASTNDDKTIYYYNFYNQSKDMSLVVAEDDSYIYVMYEDVQHYNNK